MRSSSIGSETIVADVRAELTIEIARTPEDVFSYLTDVSNLPDWQAGVKSATQRDGRIEESRSMFGRELQTTFEIVDQEEPRLFTLRALDGPVRFTVRHELEPADGGTRLTVIADGDVPGFAAGLLARARREADPQGLRAPEADPRELGRRAPLGLDRVAHPAVGDGGR